MPDADNKSAHPVQILKSIKDTELSVDIILMEQEMQLAKLANLNPGSILSFDKKVTESAHISVNGKRLAQGDIIQSGSNYALKLKSFIVE